MLFSHLLIDELVYLVERHNAVPAAQTARNLAVAPAILGEEIETLPVTVVFAVIAPLRGGQRGKRSAVIAAMAWSLRQWGGEGGGFGVRGAE